MASDITFIGALIYMGIVAWMFMGYWIQSVEYDNPIAFTVLIFLIIQYIFLIANNQLFIERGKSLETICLLSLCFVEGIGVTSYHKHNNPIIFMQVYERGRYE